MEKNKTRKKYSEKGLPCGRKKGFVQTKEQKEKSGNHIRENAEWRNKLLNKAKKQNFLLGKQQNIKGLKE